MKVVVTISDELYADLAIASNTYANGRIGPVKEIRNGMNLRFMLEKAIQQFVDEDPNVLKARIDDARYEAEKSLKQVTMLTEKLDEVSAKWSRSFQRKETTNAE